MICGPYRRFLRITGIESDLLIGVPGPAVMLGTTEHPVRFAELGRTPAGEKYRTPTNQIFPATQQANTRQPADLTPATLAL